MKTHLSKPLLVLAVCTATAMPLAAAPREDSSSHTKTTATKSSTDRRIDFGKPVRFVKNTFSRDNDRQDQKSMNRSQRQRDDDQGLKNDGGKEGFLSRMLSWRPFSRDKDQ